MTRNTNLKPRRVRINLRLSKPHEHQLQILRDNARFRVVACGRRFGKTTLGQHAILSRALTRHQTCWWLAPTYAMSGQVWRDLKGAVRGLPGIRISQTELRIDFPGGGSIEVHSTLIPDHLRGAGLEFVVLDEAAFMLPDVWPEVVRPMLVESQGRALFLSSPNGRNWFWEAYQKGITHKPDWSAFHFATAANPLITPAELDSIRQDVPERIWHVEYQALFTDDLGQVFRGIRDAATAPLLVRPEAEGRYVIGVDWARHIDFTAMIVIDARTKAVVAIDRFNHITWELQRGRLKALCDRWNPRVIYAEENSFGSPNIEALQREGLPVRPFRTSHGSKPDLIDALSLAIERRHIALQPHEDLLNELASYTLERLPQGGYRYFAPPGLHDDLVIALALAYYASQRAGLGIA